MASHDEPEKDAAAIRVTDRRRLAADGSERAAGPEPEASVRPPAEPAASPSDQRPGRPAEAAEPAGEPRGEGLPAPGLDELGIEVVFVMFWQSAAMHLGAEGPDGVRLPVDLAQARESIEILRVLARKTEGNLTEEESHTLRRLLHDAQMRYVHAASGGGENQA